LRKKCVQAAGSGGRRARLASRLRRRIGKDGITTSSLPSPC
jgi:hypothetical protein